MTPALQDDCRGRRRLRTIKVACGIFFVAMLPAVPVRAEPTYPVNDPVRPDDLAATMFYLLGIDPKTEIRDALNRPLPISAGEVIHGVLA